MNIRFQQDDATCHVTEATLDVLRPVSKDRIISRRADVVWPPLICDLTPLHHYLWGAVKDKCYAEAIDALKDNIRKDIGEIQPRQPFEGNYFPSLTGRIVLSNKNLRKYS